MWAIASPPLPSYMSTLSLAETQLDTNDMLRNSRKCGWKSPGGYTTPSFASAPFPTDSAARDPPAAPPPLLAPCSRTSMRASAADAVPSRSCASLPCGAYALDPYLYMGCATTRAAHAFSLHSPRSKTLSWNRPSSFCSSSTLTVDWYDRHDSRSIGAGGGNGVGKWLGVGDALGVTEGVDETLDEEVEPVVGSITRLLPTGPTVPPLAVKRSRSPLLCRDEEDEEDEDERRSLRVFGSLLPGCPLSTCSFDPCSLDDCSSNLSGLRSPANVRRPSRCLRLSITAILAHTLSAQARRSILLPSIVPITSRSIPVSTASYGAGRVPSKLEADGDLELRSSTAVTPLRIRCVPWLLRLPLTTAGITYPNFLLNSSLILVHASHAGGSMTAASLDPDSSAAGCGFHGHTPPCEGGPASLRFAILALPVMMSAYAFMVPRACFSAPSVSCTAIRGSRGVRHSDLFAADGDGEVDGEEEGEGGGEMHWAPRSAPAPPPAPPPAPALLPPTGRSSPPSGSDPLIGARVWHGEAIYC